MKESKTLHRVTAAVLTILFLGFVFLNLGMSLKEGGQDIRKAMQMNREMRATLPEHPTVLDKLAARINGFTTGISNAIWLKEEMGYANSAVQYALGKRLINTGSQNMLTLNTGHLYDLNDYRDLSGNAADIAELRRTVCGDYPFLFVYEHPTLYDDAMMPEAYAPLDHSKEMADAVTAQLRSEGIQVLDSRDVLPQSGYALDDLLMVTDQHWSTLAAIVMAQNIAGELNDMTGATLNVDALSSENLDTEVHEKLFMGKYGQRVGTAFVTPDDIVEYWPKGESHIHATVFRYNELLESEGEFREAVTRTDVLEPDPGKTWNKKAYMDYGLVEPYAIYENPDAPDFTVLLLKDSYSQPIGVFLSLAARRVVCVDMRQAVDPLETWLENYRPDAVVMSYSLQMLRDDAYDFQ